ncbi:MAG: universal stress protein [Hyphomicrobiaceae bacterium]
MTYKTILVHCNDKRRVGRTVGAAVELAEQFQAHLVGLSVSPPVLVVPAGVPGSPDTMVIDERAQVYRRDNPAMKTAFQAALEGKTLTSEWREEDAGTSTIADVVIRHACTADLIVAAQRDWHWSVSVELDVVDRVAVAAGRPVLIVPNEGVCSGIGSSVVVAWNGRREATRAAFDALPLLQQAKEVKVLVVDPPAEGDPSEALPAADLCTALARHGITCEAVAAASDGNVGATLLSRAIEYRADLLVMGCYGHSRLSELVFGGATRHILRHMTIPVLMSH